MPPKTVIEKAQSPAPGVTIFKIAGTLGFHEKETLEKLFRECKKRQMTRIVLDVDELTSLGGGCASILRSEADGGDVVVCLAGAKPTALKFLQREESCVLTANTLDEAIRTVMAIDAPAGSADVGDVDESDDDLVNDAVLNAVLSDPAEPGKPDEASSEPAPGPEKAAPKTPKPEPVAASAAPEPKLAPEAKPTPEAKPAAEPSPAPKSKPAPDPAWTAMPQRESEPAVATAVADPEPALPVSEPSKGASTRELQKRIVQYNTLFAINTDFARIQDRKSLLELFLLTTIAQVGVESALFLEGMQNYYVPAAMKGVEAEDVKGFALSGEGLCLDEWLKEPDVYTIDESPFRDEAKAPLLSLGCRYVAPFIVHGVFRGVIVLGKPIKNDLDSATIDFLKILINQAALAYGGLARFQEENERTLGLVQTLIALIEENTLARGNTHLLSSYVYALAQGIHYAEERQRDLMYGTVLRDIGMIKVSDLIVRSPRELMPEEWEIIKRHPIDGAVMLQKMKFSDHAINIVLCHHERFNGEGYPNGVHGQDIPLGARVVSVVESFAAMLQERPTRPALTREEALNTLRENWGMRYDPDVVNAFVEIVEEEIRSGERVADRKFELFSV